MTTYRDYTREEVARRGRNLYETHIRPLVEEGNKGRYVAINIETGEWEIGDDISAPANRLHARHPEAALFTVRVGYAAAARIGGRTWERPRDCR